MRKNLVCMAFLLFCCAASFAQQLTDEEKQRIIARLDSSDENQDLRALSDIVKHNIVEAVPLIEEKMWHRDNAGWDVYLDALLYLRSANLPRILNQMIDSSDVLGTRPFDFGGIELPSWWNPTGIRIMATEYLFKLGDYSTARYVFEALRQQQSMFGYDRGFILLEDVAENVPEYRDSAKAELIKIARNATYSGNRGRAQHDLIEVFGEEIFPEMVYWGRNDSDGANRLTALLALSTLGYPELRSFLIERLAQESFVSYKQDIAELLLTQFGGVRDYQMVKNYVASETYAANKIIVGDALKDFKPPTPQTTTPISVLLDSLVSIKHQTAALGWLSDANFVAELDNDLQSARSALVSEDSSGCVSSIKAFQSKVDTEYRDSLDNDGRTVTVEGWKFLYYNTQYILDRLPNKK